MRCAVTGGSGSFGAAFVEHLLHDNLAERVVVVARDEHKLGALGDRLLPTYSDRLRIRMGDVRDLPRLRLALSDCDTVVHAAALKVIGQGTMNPTELIQTNILGTENVLRAAMECGVKRVLVISSDKATSPANLYGNTKALAEGLSMAWNAYGFAKGMRSAAVRYGNVIGSRGSVLHVFRAAVREGRPLPVTDPRMTRFWITASVAGRFVLACLERMRGGEVFAPKMPSFRLLDLGAAVLDLDALGPASHVVTGIRPGEKLHEALIAPEEAARTRDLGDAYVIESPALLWNRPPWEGKRLPEGIGLTSDRNGPWLSVAEMRRQIGAIP